MQFGGWWVFALVMPFVMLAVAFLMMRAMRGMFFSTGEAPRARPGPDGRQDADGDEGEDGDDRAMSILRQRYARGEIDLEEDERRLEPLLRHERVCDRR